MSSTVLEKLALGQEPIISGTLFFRDAAGPKLPPGTKLMLVVGVVAVDESLDLHGESMIPVTGYEDFGSVALMLSSTQVYTLDRKYGGWNVNQLLTQPIWRV